MRAAIQFAILGIGAGSIYALLAQGVVLIYRASGVINFAHGAMAMIGAFAFYVLREEMGWPTLLALLATLAISAGIGAGTYRWVMRPLRAASPLARQIATLGVLSVLLSIASLTWGGDVRALTSSLPTDLIELGDWYISQDRLLLLVIAGAITVGLGAVFRRTTFGLATTGLAEHPTGLALLGWSPEQVALANWTLGATLAGLAGILMAPITGLSVQTLTFLVIPALAAALLGGFRSFPLVLGGALFIGIAESELSYYFDSRIARIASFAAILLVVVIRGRGLPIRGDIADRLPGLGSGRIRPVPVLVAGVVTSVLAATVLSIEVVESLTLTLLVGMLVLSLVVVTGYAGQLSLAQYALAGVGALIAAYLVAEQGWPFLAAAIVAVLGASAFGVVFALPALRTRGVNLAIITLGLGAAIHSAVFVNPEVYPPRGLVIGEWSIFGISFDPSIDPRPFAVLCVVAFVGVALVVANVRRSAAGRRLVAVRSNERAAASLGISVTGAKLYAFAVASGLAAVAGVLMAFENRNVNLGEFAPFSSIQLFAYALIGGIAYVLSPLFGAALAPDAILPVLGDKFPLVKLGQYATLFGGIGMVLVLNRRPDGLASIFHRRARADVALAARAAASTDAAVTKVRTARHRVQPATLEVRGATVRYGVTMALEDADLRVGPGEVVGLIGPNGAGKTTFLDAVTGFTRAVRGEIHLDGEPIDGWSVHKRARRGIGRSFQGLELFEDLTVRENLQIASDDGAARRYLTSLVRPGVTPLSAAALAAVEDFDLETVLDVLPAELPHGIRHQVAIARAVAREPSILLLDEPAAGLDEHESLELSLLVRRLADEWGFAIVLIEHDVGFVMRICDRITVLDFGRVIAEGPPDDVRRDDAVIAAYLGVDEMAAP